MTPNPASFLFTSVGRRVELIEAFKDARRDLAVAGSIVAVDNDPLAPALHAAEASYLVPRLDDANYGQALLAVCRRHAVNRIFPLIDPDVPVLAGLREQFEGANVRLAVVPDEAISIVADKWLTTAFFRNIGLRVPESWLPEECDLAALRYPIFVKPRGGSASKGAVRAHGPLEAASLLAGLTNPILQQFVDGVEITCDVLADVDGTLLAVVCRQRIEVRSGEVQKGVTVHDEGIIAACARIAQHLPARGPITVQCIVRDGIPYFTEINARLGGGSPLAIAAGAAFPRWLIARAAGLPLTLPAIGDYEVALHMTRYDQTRFLKRSELERLESHRL